MKKARPGPGVSGGRPAQSAKPMELRKIQVTGGSSYTVTLPKEWVTAASLGAGDVIGFLAQTDGSIAIYPHARAAGPQARYDVELTSESMEATFRKVVAAYLSGFDVIAVKSKKPLTPDMRRAIRTASKRIIGIEVVDEEPHQVILQDFLDPKEFHIDKGLRRMYALTRTMQEDAIKAFSDEMNDLADSFQERDDEVDRLYWMINKQYHGVLRDPTYAQKMGVNASQALNYLLLARLVERTADHAGRVATNAQALRGGEAHKKLETRMAKQARRAVDLFAEGITAFHKQDAEAANRVIEQAAAFQAAQDAVIRESLSLGGESILHVAYALDSVGRTAAYAADAAEIAINHRVAMAPS